jgi:hypothetical protein
MLNSFFISLAAVAPRIHYELQMEANIARMQRIIDRNFPPPNWDEWDNIYRISSPSRFSSLVWTTPDLLADPAKENIRDTFSSRFNSNEFMACFNEEVSLLIREEGQQGFRERISPLCRRFSEFIVTAVESALRRATEISGSAIFHPFLGMGGLSNIAKMKAFGLALRKAGVNYSEDALDDFLAIKFIRNTRSHGSWNPNQLSWLKNRGFPTDLRKFDRTHWDKMKVTYLAMMDYILAATLVPIWNSPPLVDAYPILSDIVRRDAPTKP